MDLMVCTINNSLCGKFPSKCFFGDINRLMQFLAAFLRQSEIKREEPDILE
jgi:hypothetical protein